MYPVLTSAQLEVSALERPRGAPLRVRHMAILRRSLQLLALERSAALGPVRALSDLPVAQRYQHMRKDPALFDPGLVKQLLHPEFTELLHALDEGADVRSLVAQVGSTEAGEAAHTCARTRVHAMYARRLCTGPCFGAMADAPTSTRSRSSTTRRATGSATR